MKCPSCDNQMLDDGIAVYRWYCTECKYLETRDELKTIEHIRDRRDDMRDPKEEFYRE
jgi:hypothetical protein